MYGVSENNVKLPGYGEVMITCFVCPTVQKPKKFNLNKQKTNNYCNSLLTVDSFAVSSLESLYHVVFLL